MMRQFIVVRKPARCGLTNKIIEPGGVVTCPDEHWYKILHNAGVLGDEVKELETASVKPQTQKAVTNTRKAPKHIGGGWYELPNGKKVQGKENAIKATGGGKE